MASIRNSNLLNAEFSGSTLSHLAALGVAAYDEADLSAAVVLAARTRAATGVSTSATLQDLTTILAETDKSIEALAHGGTSAAVSSELRTRYDALRMRRQLLSRIIKLRKSDEAMAARKAGPGGAKAAMRTAGDVLATLGQSAQGVASALEEGEITTAVAPGASIQAEAISTSALPRAPLHSSAGRRLPSLRNDAPLVPSSSRKKLDASRGTVAHPVEQAAASHRQRRVSVESTAPSLHPPGVERLVTCPVCSEVLATDGTTMTTEQTNDVQRHVERCLERPSRLRGASTSNGGPANSRVRGASSRRVSSPIDCLAFDVESDGETDAAAVAAGASRTSAHVSTTTRSKLSKEDAALVESAAIRGGRAVVVDDDDDDDEYGIASDRGVAMIGDPDNEGAAVQADAPSSRGKLSRADRTLFVADDWDVSAYNARQDAFAEDEAADTAAWSAAQGSHGDDAAVFVSTPDLILAGGLRIPHRISAALFPYQVAGVRWMWELHRQNVGGILGDEMGLVSQMRVVCRIECSYHFQSSRRTIRLRPPPLATARVRLFKLLRCWAHWHIVECFRAAARFSSCVLQLLSHIGCASFTRGGRRSEC